MSKKQDKADPEWSIYLIRCGDDSLYTGITKDVARRFEEHVSGAGKGAKYLRGRGPLEIVLQRAVGDRGLALRVEARVKKLARSQKEELVGRPRDLNKILNAANGGP
ncbi:MAG: putative endonuclease [Planctomycetota bacterium]|jgi:putative endonuclease